MNEITRADIELLCCPGDVIAVQYVHPDLVASLIGLAEDGEATHALCCMGNLDIVEATAFGVAETNLHNYLRGNCILTIRSAHPTPSPEESDRAIQFWDKRVLDPYDWGMIIGTIPIAFAHHVLGFFSKELGNWAVQNMPNLLGNSALSTCAELAARGIREFNPTAFPGYSSENIDPEILRTHPSLQTKAILVSPVLIR